MDSRQLDMIQWAAEKGTSGRGNGRSQDKVARADMENTKNESTSGLGRGRRIKGDWNLIQPGYDCEGI